MKKCPYCGHGNDDQAERCEHCCAGFPNEEPKDNEPEQKTVPKKKLRR